MAKGNPFPAVPSPQVLFGELSRNWGWLLALGIASVVLGAIGLGMATFLTIVTVLYFGVLLLIGGVAQLVQAFRCAGWTSALSHAGIGLLYVVAGVLIVASPQLASVALTLALGAMLLAAGVLRLVIAVQHRGTAGAGWAMAGGVVTIILGLLIVARWPLDAPWVIGTLVAVELIVNGWTLIALALAARTSGPAPAAGAARA